MRECGAIGDAGDVRHPKIIDSQGFGSAEAGGSLRRLGTGAGATGGVEVMVTHLVIDDAVVGLG